MGSRRRGRRRRGRRALRARPQARRASARPQHAGPLTSLDADPSARLEHPRDQDRRADDAGRARVRARCAERRGDGVRPQGGCRRRARRRHHGARRRARATSTRDSARSWRRRRRSRGPARCAELARGRGAGADRARAHQRGDRRQAVPVSVRTVETHRAHIQQKTGRSTRAELVAYALTNGLVELRDRLTVTRRRAGTIARDRRSLARPRRRSRACRRTSSTRSRIPTSPKPPRRSFGVEADAVVANRDPHDRARLPRHADLDALGVGVLDDVGQRLLHEPVERASRPPRRAASPQGRASYASVDIEPSHRRRTRRGSAATRASIAGREPELVQRRGPQLGDQRAQLRRSLISICSIAIAIAALGVAGRARHADSSTLQPGELLQRLVVQLARPARALALGGLDAAAQALCRDALRGRDGGRRAGREAREQAFVLAAEVATSARSKAPSTPTARAAVDQRYQQPRIGVDATQRARAGAGPMTCGRAVPPVVTTAPIR